MRITNDRANRWSPRAFNVLCSHQVKIGSIRLSLKRYFDIAGQRVPGLNVFHMLPSIVVLSIVLVQRVTDPISYVVSWLCMHTYFDISNAGSKLRFVSE
jgi:hypothetical protein